MSAVHEMLRRLLNVSVFVFRPSKWGRLTALEIDGRPPIQTVHKYFLFHELIFKSVLYWMFVCTCLFQNSLWFNFEIYFRPDAPNLSSFRYPVFSICHVCLLAHLWILLNVWMHAKQKSDFSCYFWNVRWHTTQKCHVRGVLRCCIKPYFLRTV